MKKALIIVDVQNDFCTGGNLEVKDGEKIIPMINDLINSKSYDLIVATKDWHPSNHKSFASNHNKKPYEMIKLNGIDQVLWTDHCIQNTYGSEFHSELLSEKINYTIYKGTNCEVDSYSGFFDNDKKSQTGLQKILTDNDILKVDVVGLALDYCVKATAMDSIKLGFDTSVLIKATKAVNISPDDSIKAIAEMKENGIKIVD